MRNLFLRGDIYYIDIMQNGKRLIQSTKTGNKKEAMAVRDRVLSTYMLRDEKAQTEAVLARVQSIDKRLEDMEGNLQTVSVSDGWKTYLAQVNRPDSGGSTLRQYEFQYEAFARWITERYPAVADLRQVTQAHADEYGGYLLERVTASTYNKHMNLLALVWRVLESKARLGNNPWMRICRKRHTAKSRRELTLDELKRVCAAAKGEMRLLLALGIYCGLRLGDAACLEWGEVDMLKGVISLIPQKTARRSQKRVTLPIHATLYAMLNECRTDRRKGEVMPKLAARYRSYNGALARDVSELFLSVNIKTNDKALTKDEKKAMKAEGGGLSVRQGKERGRRVRPECGFHSLRHTFVSLCASEGVSQSVVQALVGHGSPAMTAHYTHIGIETAKRAVASLPDITGKAVEHDSPGAVAGDQFESVLAMVRKFTDNQLGLLIEAVKGVRASRKQKAVVV